MFALAKRPTKAHVGKIKNLKESINKDFFNIKLKN